MKRKSKFWLKTKKYKPWGPNLLFSLEIMEIIKTSDTSQILRCTIAPEDLVAEMAMEATTMTNLLDKIVFNMYFVLKLEGSILRVAARFLNKVCKSGEVLKTEKCCKKHTKIIWRKLY